MNDFSDNTINLPKNPPNLYLVGFMGTGKSVVGTRVAKSMNLPFIDSDKWIEDDVGLSIPEIFKNLGEPAFRKMESDFVFKKQPKYGAIISCGGGLVTNEDLLTELQRIGIVVVLWASAEVLFDRLKGDTNRPLLQSEEPRKALEELLDAREPIYRKSGVGIMTDGRTITQITQQVIRIYMGHLK